MKKVYKHHKIEHPSKGSHLEKFKEEGLKIKARGEIDMRLVISGTREGYEGSNHMIEKDEEEEVPDIPLEKIEKKVEHKDHVDVRIKEGVYHLEEKHESRSSGIDLQYVIQKLSESVTQGKIELVRVAEDEIAVGADCFIQLDKKKYSGFDKVFKNFEDKVI